MPRITRFGPYELDAQTAELRKHGVRIRLHEQPFRILVMLLNQPGELVSREDLRKALWPNDTVVEFDHSINAAIQRLRDALSDSADKPRYVETVPRRGYRFIATVEVPEPAAAPPPAPASNFRLMGKLGQGGMGVVYRAEDLKLGRQVALKFLPVPVAEAPSQMRVRFEREARAASALNHPNICTIYGVEEFQGEPVIVMELVEGETLAARLAKGPVAPEVAQQLAVRMAGALAAAHRKGTVHRDFKPANVMLTKTGLKVLDFGLAKIQRAVAAEAETATENTQAGTVLGTVQYMSPEQVRGQEADARSDIFSFGCVMLEMLTGQRAFTGDSTADLMGAILNNDPIIKPLPPGWDRIVRRCLEKNADDRFQSAADLAFDLEAISAGTPVAALAAPARHNSWLPWAVAGLLAAGLTFVAVSHFREKPFAPTTPSHFQVLFPPNAFPRDLSPDGRNIAYITADDRLGVHSLETGQSRDVAAMDGPVLFWSPDSRFIAFQDQGKLRRIDAAGGPAQTVTDLPGPGALACGAWSPDDVIVFSQGARGLFRVPAGGGAPVQITAPNQARHEYSQLCPSLLPDGRHFVYLAVSKDEGKSAIHLGSLDLKPEQQNSQPLVASNSQAVYAPSADPGSGFLLFIREGNLMALAFDARRMETKGQPAPVAAQVSPRVTGAIWVPFSASSNGLVGFAEDGKGIRQLNWYDRDGQFLGTAGPPDLYQIFALSPDGTRAAVIKGPPSDRTRNIWLVDFSRGGASTRFTSGSLADGSPVWSPDGSRIVFSSNRDGPFNLYQRLASGVKSEEVLLKSAENKTPTSWSPDGRFLLYSVANSKTKSDIWVLPMSGGGTPMPFLVTEFNEATARFSPDGHFVAYTSNESGQSEVYVRSFSLNPSGTAVETGGKWPVSPGYQPRWRRDGRELFYTSSAGKLMAVEIETKPVFRVGSPHMLPVPQTGFDQVWDVTADGKRFLRLAEQDGPNPYNVIVNWQAGLKK